MSMALIDMKPKRGSGGKANRKVGTTRPTANLFRTAVRAFGVCLLVSGLVASIWGLSIVAVDAPYFAVDEIRLENNQRIDRDEVLRQIGINIGDSIFSVDPRLTGEALMSHPWVAVASVQRHFPRRVDILLRERAPQAIVNLGYLYYVDRDGTPFKILTAGDSLDYPAVTGIETEIDQVETTVRLRRAIEIIDAIEKNTIFTLADLSEIHLGHDGKVTLFTTDSGVPIYLGKGEVVEKIDRLSKLYQDLKSGLASIDAINLELDGKIVVRSEKFRNT